MPSADMPSLWGETLAAYGDPDTLSPTQSFRPHSFQGLATERIAGPAAFADPIQDSFEPLEELGSGGVGVVYRAFQTSLCRHVALKKLKEDGDTEKLRQRRRAHFVAEARLAGRLEHPNIVPVYSLGDTQAELAMAMKLVDGRSWQRLLAEHSGPADLASQLPILLQVCNAVAYAHSRGVVHNDLKPDNILIGPFGEVLVMDWGLAVECGARSQAVLRHATDIGSPCGTPHYMAPELASGQGGEIGPWTDIYLLGGILYRLLSGHPPHLGVTIWEVIAAAALARKLPLPEQAPAELRQICEHALAFRPEDRFQRVEELRDALAAYLQHRESLEISGAARAQLAACQPHVRGAASLEQSRRSELYEELVQAVALFGQARRLWQANPAAAAGELEARRAYAETALACGDLALSEAQAGRLADTPEHAPLTTRIRTARHKQRRERRVRRRLQQALATLVGLLLVGLVVGLLLIRQQKSFADRRSEIAERTLDTLELHVKQSLLSLGDARGLAVSRVMLGVALSGWQQLRAVHVEEQRVSRGSARALSRIGEILLGIDGDVTAAREHSQEAVAIYRALLADDGANARLLREGAEALHGLGRIEEADGALQLAHELYLEALALWRKLPQADTDTQVGLSWSLLELGRTARKTGDWSRARAFYDQALTVRRALFVNNAEMHADKLATALSAQASFLLSRRELPAAEELLDECLQLYQTYLLRGNAPWGVWRQYTQARLHHGEVSLARGRPGSARVDFEECLKHRRDLLEKAPQSMSAQRDLAIAFNYHAQACLALGELEAARASLTQSLEINRRLTSAGVAGQDTVRDLSISLQKLAKQRLADGAVEEAAELLQEMIGLRRQMLADSPSSAELQRDLAIGLVWRGRAWFVAEQAESARVCFQESLQLRRGLLSLDSSNVQAQRDLVVALGWLGDTELRSGNTAAGEAAYLEGLAWRRSWAELQANASDRENLATALDRLLDLALRRGDPAPAVEWGRESVELRRALLLDDAHAPRVRALALSLNDYARALAATGETQASLALLLESLGLQRNLIEEQPDNRAFAHGLALTLRELALLQDPPEARASLEESCQRLRDLLAGDDSPLLRGDLASSLNRLGEVCTLMQDAPAAREAFVTSLELFRQQWAESPENRRLQRDLSLGLERMGAFWLAVGQPTAAREVLEECVALRRALALASTHGESSRDLCIALARAGEAAEQDGDPDHAQKLHDEGLRVARAWLEREPESPGACYSVAFAEFSLARGAERRGKPSQAVACLERAIAQLESLDGPQERGFREFLKSERRRLLED